MVGRIEVSMSDGTNGRVTKRQLAMVCWIFAGLILTAEAINTAEQPEPRGIDGSASGSPPPPAMSIAVPTCSRDDEFLTSNGTHLLCRRIPPCTCFVDGAEPEPDPPVPLPPTGCPVYDPPLRGATACYLDTTATLMYCQVYCDHNFEFLTTPQNPYSCGPSTNFQWFDVTGRLITTFPECTAHRITIGTIHSDVNYLPSPCYGLTDHTILAIMDEFRGILRLVGVSAPPEDIFMRCPSFDGRVYIYNDVSVRATHKRKRQATQNENKIFHTNDEGNSIQ